MFNICTIMKGKATTTCDSGLLYFLDSLPIKHANKINSMEKKMRNVSLTTLLVEHLKNNRWHLKFHLRYFRWSYCNMSKKKRRIQMAITGKTNVDLNMFFNNRMNFRIASSTARQRMIERDDEIMKKIKCEMAE